MVPNDKNLPEIDSLQFAWCDFTNFFSIQLSLFPFSVIDRSSLTKFVKLLQSISRFFQLNFWRNFCYLAQLYYAARFRAFQRFTAWFLPAFGPLLFDEFYCYSVLRRCHLPYKLCCQTDSASQLGFAGIFWTFAIWRDLMLMLLTSFKFFNFPPSVLTIFFPVDILKKIR